MGPDAPPLACPHCGSADVELVSAWGGQLITSQMRCRGCHTYFEALRDDAGPRIPAAAHPDRPASDD